MMVNGVADEAGGDWEIADDSQLDQNDFVVDIVTFEAFLAALKEATSPNERLKVLIRTAPPLAE